MRTAWICILVTPDEKMKVRTDAAKMGMTITQYLLYCALVDEHY